MEHKMLITKESGFTARDFVGLFVEDLSEDETRAIVSFESDVIIAKDVLAKIEAIGAEIEDIDELEIKTGLQYEESGDGWEGFCEVFFYIDSNSYGFVHYGETSDGLGYEDGDRHDGYNSAEAALEASRNS